MTEKKHRTVQEIQNEYAQLCTRAGHLQYQVYTFAKDLEIVNATLRDLNVEAAASQQAEEEAKKEAAPAVEEKASE